MKQKALRAGVAHSHEDEECRKRLRWRENVPRHILSYCYFFVSGREKINSVPTPLGTDHIDIFIVCLNNFFYDRKPKSGSFFVFSAGEITFVKTFPYFVDT